MKLLLIAVSLLVVVDYGFSLKCFTCVSSENCEGVKMECPSHNALCLKVDGEQKGTRAVVKSCFEKMKDIPLNTCQEGKQGDVTGSVCTCDTDLCNDANAKMISQYAIFIVTSIVTLIQFV